MLEAADDTRGGCDCTSPVPWPVTRAATGRPWPRNFSTTPSAEVQRQTVAGLAQWPLEQAGPLLLAAMGKAAFVTRKTAAEQLASRWPPAAEFSARRSAPPPPGTPREAANPLPAAVQPLDRDALRQALAAPRPAAKVTPEQVDRVGQLLQQQDLRGLQEFGPGLVGALEQLVVDRQQNLPEAVYRDVLPQCQPVFATLVRLASPEVASGVRRPEN